MDDLIKRLELSEAGSRELDEAIMALMYRREQRFIGTWEDDGIGEANVRRVKDWVWVDPATDKWVSTHAKPYTTSLDAALTLVPSEWIMRLVLNMIPGPALCYIESHELGGINIRGQAVAKTAPLALCIAALRARTQEGG